MLSKSDLRNAIASKNRGIAATENDRKVIASIIARVEDANPTPDPLSAVELLRGDWRLLYTTSAELLGIDRFPLASLGEIYQCIRPESSRIYNIAELNSLPFVDGLVSVVASFEPAQSTNETVWPGADSPSTVATSASVAALQPTRRVNVHFERAVFGLQRSLGYQSPGQYIQQLESKAKFNWLQGVDFAINPNREPGWLEITYLDADLRIGRGNQGNLFVLTK